jgi:predicted mannosyl-3-phosphoglycerate phosphatase (HAD superfamily)
MAKVIFMHFDTVTDGVYDAKTGEPIVRLAKEKNVPIPFVSDGDYSKCLIYVENLSDEEPTSYMEDEELDILVKLGAITASEAEQCQQFTISPKVRIAPMMLIKGDILVKPFKLK